VRILTVKLWISSVVAAVVFAVIGCSRTPLDARIFTPEIKQAVASAKTSNKVVMVDLYADWCGWCTKLDTEVFTESTVSRILRDHFIVVRVNIDANQANAEFANKIGTTSLPYIVFLDGNGARIRQIKGFQPAAEFAQTLNKVVKANKK
jgi:thiol:disulfide interchange protein